MLYSHFVYHCNISYKFFLTLLQGSLQGWFLLNCIVYKWIFTDTVMPHSYLLHFSVISSHANSTQYCNTLSAFQLSTSCMTTSSSTSSYLSTVHPFLSGRPRKTEPTKTEAASKFFSENTRTCSMSLGMAQLFKVHCIFILSSCCVFPEDIMSEVEQN